MNAGFDDIQLLDVPDSFYAEAKAENPYACTKEERAAYMSVLGQQSTARLCDQDHYQYFKATDRALLDFVVPCASCTHVLVTNGDNGYAPEFLGLTTQLKENVVIVAFTHDRKPVAPEVKPGWIDLGAVLLRKEVIEGGRRIFLTSLPEGARAREVHDADFWYVKHAVDRFSHVFIKDRLLMYHH